MEKERNWKWYSNEVNLLKDKLGMLVDSKIKNVVIGLNANKINTKSSCGGHSNKEILFPWVSCTPGNEPEFRWENEKKIKEKIIKKYNIISKNIFFPINKEAEMEYYRISKEASETKKYKEWYKKVDPFIDNMENILKEFYKQRESKMKIVIDRNIYAHAYFMVPGEKKEKSLRKNCSNNELRKELEEAQKEMSAFGKFLKEKYFD